MNLYNKVIMDQ